MNVSLTKELERFIADRIGEGGYQTASEVVREALRLLRERESERASELQRLRLEALRGMRHILRGEYRTLDFRKLKAAGRKRIASRSGR